MTLPLPPYPNPSVRRPDDDGNTDWRLLAGRLVIVTVLSVFLAVLLVALALFVTGGQILLIFGLLGNAK
jgi:hypothetical protein